MKTNPTLSGYLAAQAELAALEAEHNEALLRVAEAHSVLDDETTTLVGIREKRRILLDKVRTMKDDLTALEVDTAIR